MNLIRKTAKLLTLPILNKNERKDARAKVEKLLHRVFKTERYRCEQAYLQILQDNRALGFERYHLVSLGYNCFGRMTFNYWGLKPRKADGEKTMPFDISVHPLSTVIKLLQTRFADYFDNMVYLYLHNLPDTKRRIVIVDYDGNKVCEWKKFGIKNLAILWSDSEQLLLRNNEKETYQIVKMADLSKLE